MKLKRRKSVHAKKKLRSAVPAVRTQSAPVPWRACDVHPLTQFRVGSFCPQCFQERTEQRVHDVDDRMAALAVKATDQVGAVLDIPVTPVVHPAYLGPILRAAEIVANRFRRPERVDANVNVRSVSVVGAPVDFTKAGVRL